MKVSSSRKTMRGMIKGNQVRILDDPVTVIGSADTACHWERLAFKINVREFTREGVSVRRTRVRKPAGLRSRT